MFIHTCPPLVIKNLNMSIPPFPLVRKKIRNWLAQTPPLVRKNQKLVTPPPLSLVADIIGERPLTVKFNYFGCNNFGGLSVAVDVLVRCVKIYGRSYATVS